MTSAVPDFETPKLAEAIEQLQPDEIDRLPFGVIGLDANDQVRVYSATEARLSGYGGRPTHGKAFFLDVVFIFVDLPIAVYDLLCKVVMAIFERLDRLVNRFLDRRRQGRADVADRQNLQATGRTCRSAGSAQRVHFCRTQQQAARRVDRYPQRLEKSP